MRCPRIVDGHPCNVEVEAFSLQMDVGHRYTLDIELQPCLHCIGVDEPEFEHVFALAKKEMQPEKEKTDGAQ